jgi:hypothetical protein
MKQWLAAGALVAWMIFTVVSLYYFFDAIAKIWKDVP